MDVATWIVAAVAAVASGLAAAATVAPAIAAVRRFELPDHLERLILWGALGASLLGRVTPAMAAPPPAPIRVLPDPAPSDPTRTAPAPTQTASTERVHVVVPGDTLWDIAAAALATRDGSRPTAHRIARYWPVVYAANREVIGDDPDLIHPGQRLRIPEEG